MTTKLLRIDGMSCGHCVKAVTLALQDVPGVDVKYVTVGTATVDVDVARVTDAHLAEVLADAGYTLESVAPA